MCVDVCVCVRARVCVLSRLCICKLIDTLAWEEKVGAWCARAGVHTRARVRACVRACLLACVLVCAYLRFC